LIKDASGNVGVGVTPSAWSGFTGFQVGRASVMGSSTDATARFLNNAYYDGSAYRYVQNGAANLLALGGAGGVQFYTAPSGTAGNAITLTEAMTLDASGNLGLGVTPISGEKLTVGGNVLALGLHTSGGNTVEIQFNNFRDVVGNNKGAAIKAVSTTISSAYDTTALSFWVNNGVSSGYAPYQAMTLDATGKLIVTPTPIFANGAIKIQGATTDYQGLSLYYAATSPNAASRAWQIAPNYIAYARLEFLISSSNSTDPTTSKGYIDGTTGAYVAVSDLRAKKNIADCSYGLAEVLAMRPVIYNMIEEEDGTDKHLGFIAQEIKQVINEAVTSTSTEEELYGLDKAGLVPVLVKAIQEQQAMIEELKAKVAALKAA
jgi:hypothetical protein